MKKNIIAFALIAAVLAAVLIITSGIGGSDAWPVIDLDQPGDPAVVRVRELIEAIPSPAGLEDESAVTAARDAYDSLTDEQKSQVDESRITAAEAELSSLKDQTAADAVSEMIASLPAELSESDLPAVESVRSAYNALTDAQKSLVSNLDVLAAAESFLAEAANSAKAAQADALIASIATPVTADSAAEIQAARAAYDALTAEQKALCENLPLLEQLESSLASLGSGTEQLAQGDTVLFTGGNVYAASNDTTPAASISGSSVCRITLVAEGKLHMYHLISTDGGGVYGWVDAQSVRLNG